MIINFPKIVKLGVIPLLNPTVPNADTVSKYISIKFAVFSVIVRINVAVNIKRIEVIEKLDHYHLNDIPPFNEIQPTAENLAKFFYDELKSKLAQYKNVEIDSVEIWETEKYSAIYQE